MSEYDCYCPDDEDLVELMSPQQRQSPPRPYRTTTVHTTSSTVIEPAESGGEADCYCEDEQGGGELATTPPEQIMRPPSTPPGAPKTTRKSTTTRTVRQLDFDDEDDYYDDNDLDCSCPPPQEDGVRRVTHQTVTSSSSQEPRSRDVMSRTRAGLAIPARGRLTPPKDKFPWMKKEPRVRRRVAPPITDENVFPHHLNLPGPEEFRPPRNLRRSPAPPLLPIPPRPQFQLYETKPPTPQEIRDEIFARCPAYTSPDASRQQPAPEWGSPIRAEAPRRGRRSRRRPASESDSLNITPIRGQGARLPGWTPEGVPTPKPNPRTLRSPPCPAYETPDPSWYAMRTPSPPMNAACRPPPAAPRAARANRRLFGEDSDSPIIMENIEPTAAEAQELEMYGGYDELDYRAPQRRPRGRHPAAEKLNKTWCYKPSERMVSPPPRPHSFSEPPPRRYSEGSPSSSCQGCCGRGCCNMSH